MNTNQPGTTKSTEELKQQVLSDINKVKEDFKEIKERMTPGQIIDDALYSRRGRGDPGETFTYLKQNPVGTTFLTLGTLLLMEDEQHRSYETLARERVVEMRERVSETGAKIGDAISERVNEAREKISETKDKVSASIDRARDTAKLDASLESTELQEKASGVIQTAKEKGQEVYDYARNLDPMIYLALGVGLGTITGAALPLTQKETEAVDSVYSEKLSTFAGEVQDALNKSVNILKNEVIGGATDFNFDLFK